ncbi:MAG TPA: HAD family phosphatase [Solirubrobacteraceae bacterium]|jgi:putative hydrolase of the HAD superfamily
MAPPQPLALLVDFGEVISRPQPEELVRAMAAEAGVGLEVFRERYWANRPEYDRGASAQSFWSAVAGRPLDADGRLERLIELDNASWSVINEDTMRVLGEAREHGHSLSLLSNAPHEFADAMASNPVLAGFEHVIFSAWIGVIKPDPGAFAAAVQRLGRPPEEILFVDDREANVEGARAAGLRAVQFTSAEQLRGDLRD